MDIHFDFTLILTLATLVTGVVYAMDKLIWAKKRLAEGQGKHTKKPPVIDFSRSFFPVLLLVLVIRSFIVEPFRIPSGSMIPTLLVGDFIVVTKYSYGLKLPVLNTKLIEVGEPQRGDTVVFRYPLDPSIDFIKRVIGVPGDTVIYADHRLFINGMEIQSQRVGDFHYTDTNNQLNLAVEKIENLLGYEHRILNHNHGSVIDGRSIHIPEGHYFVMGDNRSRSKDSRIWGLVSDRDLVGKAQFIWMHWGWEGLSRIGTKIQ